MEEFEIAFRDIPFKYESIYRLMGYRDNEPDPRIREMIGEMMAELETVCRPRFGYGVFEGAIESDLTVRVSGVEFRPGRTITSSLKGASRYILFVATTGREFEAWLNAVKAENDIVRLFVADAIGSILADNLSFVGVERLEQRYAGTEMKLSNPYSPGYCGWHVREQKGLFSLLPKGICGVELTESCLMIPIKSVSGMVAMGKEVEKRPYGCAICGMKTCIGRNSQA